MPLDKEELKKLSPEKRIKRLKQIEKERKKEIEEAEDLIKRTEAEIQREKDIPDIEVPKIEPVDISKIFEAPEGLETTVRREVTAEEEESPIKYGGVIEQIREEAYQPDEHAKIEFDAKVEETVKYESATQKADDLTGSRSVLKNIKKYTRG